MLKRLVFITQKIELPLLNDFVLCLFPPSLYQGMVLLFFMLLLFFIVYFFLSQLFIFTSLSHSSYLLFLQLDWNYLQVQKYVLLFFHDICLFGFLLTLSFCFWSLVSVFVIIVLFFFISCKYFCCSLYMRFVFSIALQSFLILCSL